MTELSSQSGRLFLNIFVHCGRSWQSQRSWFLSKQHRISEMPIKWTHCKSLGKKKKPLDHLQLAGFSLKSFYNRTPLTGTWLLGRADCPRSWAGFVPFDPGAQMPPTLCHTLNRTAFNLHGCPWTCLRRCRWHLWGRRYKESLSDLTLQTYLPDESQRHC